MNNAKQTEARQRANVILQVRSGQMTASEGARTLGISRKTYYQWEKRGLEAMIAGLEEQAPGRPSKSKDPEKEAMAQQIVSLTSQLEAEQQRATLRAALNPLLKKESPRKAIKKKKNN
jgi:transposase